MFPSLLHFVSRRGMECHKLPVLMAGVCVTVSPVRNVGSAFVNKTAWLIFTFSFLHLFISDWKFGFLSLSSNTSTIICCFSNFISQRHLEGQCKSSQQDTRRSGANGRMIKEFYCQEIPGTWKFLQRSLLIPETNRQILFLYSVMVSRTGIICSSLHKTNICKVSVKYHSLISNNLWIPFALHVCC